MCHRPPMTAQEFQKSEPVLNPATLPRYTLANKMTPIDLISQKDLLKRMSLKERERKKERGAEVRARNVLLLIKMQFLIFHCIWARGSYKPTDQAHLKLIQLTISRWHLSQSCISLYHMKYHFKLDTIQSLSLLTFYL